MGHVLVIYPTRKSDNGLYSLSRALMSACVDGTVRLGRGACSRACSRASAHGISGADLPNKCRRPIPTRIGSSSRWLNLSNLRLAVNWCRRHSSFSQETRRISVCITVFTILGYIPAKINHNMSKQSIAAPDSCSISDSFLWLGDPVITLLCHNVHQMFALELKLRQRYSIFMKRCSS